MAITYVRELAANKANGVSDVTAAFTTTATATAGDLVVLSFISKQSTQPSAATVTDTRGNTWTVDAGPIGTINNNILIASTVQNAGALQSGDTITVTFTGGVGMTGFTTAWWVEEFTGNQATGFVDKSATLSNGSGLTGGSGTTAATTSADEVAVAAIIVGSVEATLTAASYSSFTTAQQIGASRSGLAVYKILSATGAQSETFNWTTTADVSYGAIVTYIATPVVTATPPLPQWPRVRFNG